MLVLVRVRVRELDAFCESRLRPQAAFWRPNARILTMVGKRCRRIAHARAHEDEHEHEHVVGD